MANRGIRRYIQFILDRTSAKKAGAEMEATLAQAGEEGGKKFYRTVRAAFEKTKAELDELRGKGLIDDKEHARRLRAASKAYNTTLLKSMDEARRKGELTDREYVKLTRTLKKVGDDGTRSASRLTTGFGKVVTLLASAFAVRAFARWTADVVQLGVAGSETASKFDTTFGEARGSMDRFVDSFRVLAGMSRNEAREFTATTGAMARGMGYTEQAAADLAKQVAIVAGDLTSFNNIPIEQTSRAVRSALTGERESLKTLGIVVMQAEVDQRALMIARQEGTAAITQQHKAAATLQLIQERMGPAAGDLVRTQNSLANESRRVAAAWRTFKEELGESISTAEGGTSALGSVSAAIETLTAWLNTNRDALQNWVSTALASVAALAQVLGFTTPAKMGAAMEIASIGRQGGGEAALKNRLSLLEREREAIEQEQKRLEASRTGRTGWGRNSPEAKRFAAIREELEQMAIVEAYLRGQIENPPKAVSDAGGTGTGKPTGLTPEQIKEREKAFDDEIKSLVQAHKLGVLRNEDIVRGIVLYEQLSRAAKDDSLSRDQRVRAGDRAGQLEPFDRLRGIGIKTGTVGGDGIQRESGIMTRDVGEAAEEQADAWSQPWVDAIDRVEEEALAKGGVFQELGEAWAQGGIVGLGKLFAMKARQNLAEAAEWFARAAGLFISGNPLAGAAVKVGAQHLAVATAWKGASAALGGGSGSASAGAGGGSANVGAAAADRAQPLPSEVHVYLNPLSASDPAFVRETYAANQIGQRYFGENATVHVHPYPRRGG